MSGIAGIWHPDGRPLDPDALERMSAALAHRGERQGVWTDGDLGFACWLRPTTPEAADEEQPLVGAEAAVVFDGRLDDREALLADLPGFHRHRPDPEIILAAWGRWGEAAVERLRGDFAVALWDRRRQRLLLARDSLGVRPLYWVEAPGLVLFASEIKPLLAHPAVTARPDDEQLAALLFGDLRGTEERTCFRGIAVVPPATMVVVDRLGSRRRRYWDFDLLRVPPARSFPEAAAWFRAGFEQALRRRLRSSGPVAVSVSGGLDSSAVFCLAHRLAVREPGVAPVVGISYVPPEGGAADERALLEVIERHLGVEIERVTVEPDAPLDGWGEAVWWAEAPFVDEQWTTTVAHFQAIRQRGCRLLLTGHWGDEVLFDQAYLVDLARSFRWAEVSRHLVNYARWHRDCPPRVFWTRFLRDLIKWSLPPALLTCLRRCRARRAPHWFGPRLRRQAAWGCPPVAPTGVSVHARALWEQARSPYHVLCLEWQNKVAAAHGLEVAFPFLDRDLLAGLMALPGDLVTWQGVPKALLREGLREILPPPIAARDWKADFTELVNASVARDLARLMDVLETGQAVARGYLDPTGLRRAQRRWSAGLRGPEATAAWRVAEVAGLEVWLRVFGPEAGARVSVGSVAGGRP